MTFNPALPTVRDQIRSDVGDTSNDPATEMMVDATYDAYLGLYPENWKRAAARIAIAILTRLDQDVKSYSAPGDLSVTFRDHGMLRALADRWNSEADAETAELGYGRVVTVTSDYLTGWPVEEGVI